MAPLRNSRFWVPQSVKYTYYTMPNGNIAVKNFQHVFGQLSQIRVSYFFDIGNFFTKKISQKNKFGKIIFCANNFFLTLKLKSVNSISSSFDKTVKRPINYFSQTFTEMPPPHCWNGSIFLPVPVPVLELTDYLAVPSPVPELTKIIWLRFSFGSWSGFVLKNYGSSVSSNSCIKCWL